MPTDPGPAGPGPVNGVAGAGQTAAATATEPRPPTPPTSGRAQRPKPAKLVLEPRLGAVVEAKLSLGWSPQQITGWLPLAYPSDPVLRVSHETIDLSLLVQSRGALRRELQHNLRTGRAMRYPRGKRLPKDAANSVTPSTSASDPLRRPTGRCPALGRRPGVRPAPQRGRTLVERHSRYVLLVPLPNGFTAEGLRPELTTAILRLPQQLRRSLTWDQGREMAEHTQFTIDSGIQV